MTNIEQKALELVNEVLAEWGVLKNAVEIPKNSDAFARALLRAIEQHEAFRQEVSDALEKRGFYIDDRDLGRFIIAKPDPLEKLLQSIAITLDANDLREALDEAGLEIREKGK